jgi:hypothetical protein
MRKVDARQPEQSARSRARFYHRGRLSFRVIQWVAREAGGQLLPLCSLAFAFCVTHQPCGAVDTEIEE